MTKANAKLVVAQLIENGYSPQIIQDGPNDYRIRVHSENGVSTSAAANFESSFGVTAAIKTCEFS